MLSQCDLERDWALSTSSSGRNMQWSTPLERPTSISNRKKVAASFFDAAALSSALIAQLEQQLQQARADKEAADEAREQAEAQLEEAQLALRVCVHGHTESFCRAD